MKTLFTVSIILNLVLAVGLALLLQGRPNPVVRPLPSVTVKTNGPANLVMAQTQPKVTSSTNPAPFRWSQLWGRTYYDYIKNLRGIGCPEGALRAIVSADVHAVFKRKTQDLEKKIADLDHGSWTNQIAGADTEIALKSKLQQIPEVEAAEIDKLLGIEPALAQVSPKEARSRDQPISVPLALQNVDLTSMNLSDDQKQVLASIRQSFLDQIGGTNQDANDPAYLERWQQAQPQADNMLRGMLGTSFYLNYQLAAFQNNQSGTAGNDQNPAANP